MSNETQAGVSEVRPGQRIAKVMARAGVCSRRDAEAWIAEGRVAVNGEVLKSPAFNVSETDDVRVDGKKLAAPERTRLFLFHKPRGLVTTARDPEGRQTVFAVLPPDLPRLVAIGRLDINTEGLLLLTNDGGLARVLELPSTGWLRRYRVRAHGIIEQAALDRLSEGVTIDGIAYLGVEAKLDRELTVQFDQPGCCDRRRRNPGEEAVGKRRVGILEGEMHRHVIKIGMRFE